MSTRERLIESTRTLLWERGYVATSPKTIQQLADAGQGSMYHHFSGKEELARVAIDRTAEEMRASVGALLSGPGTPLERISTYLRREREVMKGCPIGRLTQDPDVMATPMLVAPVAETLNWLRERLAALVAEGVADGELNPALDPVTTAAAIVATLQGGYVLARAANDPQAFQQAIEGVLALLGAPSVR
ncbi:TetR/AcrR family transcriptional regulator [Catenulispora rubra]|uniref:TetR/AcrR family transcriptional regulator n=1 Tax=Catenulispora rubra TaxID=280293 RepID=UPI002B278814|nr:TetR/AcrR family transcriptional regulator [Catenulispora rubra]